MIVGFLGFGELAINLSKIFIENSVEILTYTKDRSIKTKELANLLKVKQIDSKDDLKDCDYLFSAVSPLFAKEVAIDSLNYYDGIFIDLNNISSKTAIEINSFFTKDDGSSNYVDTALLGSIKNKKHNFIAATDKVDEINNLKNYGLDIEIISDKVGDASNIKMLRSFYTKGVSSIVFETFLKAEELGLTEELFKHISSTEGEVFINSSKSRIKNSALHADRKAQEILEIKDLFHDSILINSFYTFYKDLDYKMHGYEDFSSDKLYKLNSIDYYEEILKYLNDL